MRGFIANTARKNCEMPAQAIADNHRSFAKAKTMPCAYIKCRLQTIQVAQDVERKAKILYAKALCNKILTL